MSSIIELEGYSHSPPSIRDNRVEAFFLVA